MIPDIAAAQFLLIDPHFDAHGGQRNDDAPCRAGVFMGGKLEQALGGVGPAVQQHVLDPLEQVLRDLLVDRELPGVDDAHVEAGLDGVVQERRVDGLADHVVAEIHPAQAAPQGLFGKNVALRRVRPQADDRGHVPDVPALLEHQDGNNRLIRTLPAINQIGLFPQFLQFLLALAAGGLGDGAGGAGRATDPDGASGDPGGGALGRPRLRARGPEHGGGGRRAGRRGTPPRHQGNQSARCILHEPTTAPGRRAGGVTRPQGAV